MIAPTALLVILLSADFTVGTEKQVKLEDIERDNLLAKQVQQQPQEQQHVKPQQQPNAPEYTDQQLSYPVQQQLQAYQPQLQFQAPPAGGVVALYLPGSGIAGDYAGIVPDVTYVTPQHQGVPNGPPVYLHQGGYTGLQFVQAPPSPFIYSNQLVASPQQYHVLHSPIQKEAPSILADANIQTQHNPRVPQSAYQHLRVPVPAPVNTDLNFVYTSQQAYNPIPKELQSYTTIPRAVYEGKEPDFVDNQQPSVSLTNDAFIAHNSLYQQPKPQRPVFSPGVKSGVPSSLKAFPSSGSFLVPTRHLPGAGISYNSYRQGPRLF